MYGKRLHTLPCSGFQRTEDEDATLTPEAPEDLLLLLLLLLLLKVDQ